MTNPAATILKKCSIASAKFALSRLTILSYAASIEKMPVADKKQKKPL
jgi:hypothetical protein